MQAQASHPHDDQHKAWFGKAVVINYGIKVFYGTITGWDGYVWYAYGSLVHCAGFYDDMRRYISFVPDMITELGAD